MTAVETPVAGHRDYRAQDQAGACEKARMQDARFTGNLGDFDLHAVGDGLTAGTKLIGRACDEI